MKRYDSHVRARASLARKVAQRRLYAGMNQLARASFRWAIGKMPEVEDLIPAAYAALAVFEWPEGWGVKYSRFRIFGRPMYVDGQSRDVPARIVERIMRCMPDLPQFTSAGMRELATLELEAQEARERVTRLEREEDDADARCMATTLDDRDLPRYRDHSVHVSHSLEQARDDLARVERHLREWIKPEP